MMFTVETMHPNDPAKRWTGSITFKVGETTDENGKPLFYAKAENFGCGRNARSPEKAIQALAADNAATVLRITPRDYLAEIVAEHDTLTKPAAPAAATAYTFHRAEDHSILATAQPFNLNIVAAYVAARINRDMTDADRKTTRIYVHNGAGVIGAGLCRDGLWHDILRDDYRQFDKTAREIRDTAGLTND